MQKSSKMLLKIFYSPFNNQNLQIYLFLIIIIKFIILIYSSLNFLETKQKETKMSVKKA